MENLLGKFVVFMRREWDNFVGYVWCLKEYIIYIILFNRLVIGILDYWDVNYIVVSIEYILYIDII